MSRFDSKSLCNICIIRLQGPLLLTSVNMITNPYQFSALKQKENSLCEHKFDWLHFKKWCGEFRKRTGLFSSSEVLSTNLATNVYLRELNINNQPKTLTVTVVLVSHQIVKIEAINSQCWTPHFVLQFQKETQKIIPQHWNQWPINFNELLSVAHLITHSSGSQTLWSWN